MAKSLKSASNGHLSRNRNDCVCCSPRKVQAVGDSPPYIFSAPCLPPALALDASGNLTGRAMVPGDYVFRVQVTDSAGAIASQVLELSISDANSYLAPVPSALVGSPYSGSILGPMRRQVLTRIDSCLVYRRAYARHCGNYQRLANRNRRLRILDYRYRRRRRAVLLQADPCSFNSPRLSGYRPGRRLFGTHGNHHLYTGNRQFAGCRHSRVPYSRHRGHPALLSTAYHRWDSAIQLHSAKCSGPCDYPTGLLTGVPQQPGTLTLGAQVTDAGGELGSPFDLPIVIQPQPLAVVTQKPWNAHPDVAYVCPLLASGGTPPYKWSAPALPAGLKLSRSGIIFGLPAQAQSAPVLVTVQDAARNTATASLSLFIDPTVPAISPGGVTSAASYQNAAVSPSEIITIFGSALGRQRPCR